MATKVSKPAASKTKVAKPAAKQAPADDGANLTALQKLYGVAGDAAGKELAQEFIPDGSLGRLDTNVPGQQDYLNQLKAGLGGYTADEYQAQREQANQGTNSNLATSLGQLAKSQAQGKVYGAAASAQQANTIQNAQNTKDNNEQALMVSNINNKQNLLSQYGTALNSANAMNEDIAKTNLGQQDAEKSGQISAYTGAAGTSLTAAQTAAAQKIQQEAVNKLNN